MQQLWTEQHPAVAIIMSTFPSAEVAEAVVRALVEECRIACGTIIPNATSIYRWQGTVERAHEVQVFLKSSMADAPLVCARLAELHPYEVPEVVVLPVAGGHAPYLQWVTGG
jgi:periplasmic divalent cation tolerance protein